MRTLRTFVPKTKRPIPLGGVVRSEFRCGRHTVTLVQDVTGSAGVKGKPGDYAEINLAATWDPADGRGEVLTPSEVQEYDAGLDQHLQHVVDVLQRPLVLTE